MKKMLLKSTLQLNLKKILLRLGFKAGVWEISQAMTTIMVNIKKLLGYNY